MHQLITEDAVVVANVITEDAVTGAVAGALLRFFPPIPSNTIKVMTLGIQATLSYLSESVNIGKNTPIRCPLTSVKLCIHRMLPKVR